MVNIFDAIAEILRSGHPAVIHFPLIGAMMGAVAAISALLIAIFIDIAEQKDWLDEGKREFIKRYIDRFEFSSWILIIMGEAGIIIAGITGMNAAGDAASAVTVPLLQYKIMLSIYGFFILLAPLVLKLYLSLGPKKPVFSGSRIIPILYIIPIVIAAVMMVLISGAGGRYTYGHSILDPLGLGWALPS